MSDLETALNGEEVETAEIETEVVETEEPTGEEVPAAEGEADLAAQLEKANAEIEAFKAKAIDETGKRQSIEQQMLAMQQPATEKPDFWDNPDQAISAVKQEFDTKLQQVNTNAMVSVMKTVHEDYDEMEQLFIEAAKTNPSLVAQMNQSGNPAKFAYEYGKTQTQMAEYSNPEEMRAKMKAELLAEIEEEKKAEIESEIQKRTGLPGSLVTERGAGATSQSSARPELDKLIG